MAGPKSFFLDSDVHTYLVDHGTPPDAVLEGLRVETEALGEFARMQIAPEQGAFFTMLTRLLAPRLALEVGTFTGYSALCIARGLPTAGRLMCCDVNEEWTAIARRHWDAAGVADRIDLRIAPAIDTLRMLPRDARIDLAFIDADKGGYGHYFEEILSRLSPDGVMIFDNVLWSGAVLGDGEDPDTVSLQRFNDAVAADERVEAVMLPVGDGLTFVTHRL